MAAFTSAATRENGEPVQGGAAARLLSVLSGLGTSMGIRRVTVTGRHGGSERDAAAGAAPVREPCQLRAALRELVNAMFAARDAMGWGTGTVCASGSGKFGAWSRNLMTEWHQRYRGPGVMICPYVERNSVCIYPPGSSAVRPPGPPR
ncbi:Tn3 family transposase [Streptomyces brevispora]|uniref:Tn3 family transposase n=1 Tax=Streptomyces brevispora TaxID=887462 RepID=UPI0033D0A742